MSNFELEALTLLAYAIIAIAALGLAEMAVKVWRLMK